MRRDEPVVRFPAMVDFHTHLLPQIDDGSQSVEESLSMLGACRAQGVRCVVLTPHFYAGEDRPARFLARRERALTALRERVFAGAPILLPGAEVLYFDGIAAMEEIRQLCIGQTELLLLEMPMGRWSSRAIRDVLYLRQERGVRVILAHIERFMGDQPHGTLENLAENGVLMQVNAEFFLRRFSRRRALRMLEEGLIHAVGSDCHNMTSRPPCMGAAMQQIGEKLGAEAVQNLNMQMLRLLQPVETPAHVPEKIKR